MSDVGDAVPGVTEGIVTTRYDGADGWWEMARRTPPPALAGDVVGFCGYAEATPAPLRRRETPTGRVTVILSFGDPVEVVEMSESPQPAPGRVTSFVAGVHEGYALVDTIGRQSGIQIDLTPLGARRLLGLPMRSIANQVVELDAVRGRAVHELTERLAGEPDWATRFRLLDEVLVRWAEDGPDPDPAVAWAWGQLDGSAGQARVGDLAAEIGWSRRHFVRRFQDQVGLAPKSTGRVLRFRRAVALLQQRRPDMTIADVAAAGGYADHSHLDREFRRLAGVTPSAYLAAVLPATGGTAG